MTRLAGGAAGTFAVQVRRDLRIALRNRSELANPLMFFLMAAAMFPLGLGPNEATLREIAPGILWVLALLATLLSLEGMFRRDFEDGSLELFVMRADPLFVGVMAKVCAHWLVTGLPLALLAPVLGLLLFLPGDALPVLVASLLLGTPVLSLIGSIGAGLTVGLRRGGLLLTLLILPLYVPVLILGAGAVTSVTEGVDPSGQILWLAAMLAAAVTLAPFGAALALRVGMEQ